MSAVVPSRASIALRGAAALAGASLLALRHHPRAALVAAVAGALTLALGLPSPARLARFERILARALTTALLTAVYALAVMPVRAALAVLRIDPFASPPRDPATHWEPRAARDFSRDDFERTS